LPTATSNKFRRPVSFISKKPIVGACIEFANPHGASTSTQYQQQQAPSDKGSNASQALFASKNEMLQWISVLPYAPTLTGEFVNYNIF
jgi:hypothetical protein